MGLQLETSDRTPDKQGIRGASKLGHKLAPDPIPLESKIVIDATGHDASVARKLEQRGLIKLAGEGLLWIEKSEDAIVEHTGEVAPGLIITGMDVATVYNLPRMGPTFWGDVAFRAERHRGRLADNAKTCNRMGGNKYVKT